MGFTARNLLIQLLLPLAAVCATVTLRLPVAAKRLLLLRAALSVLMGVLGAAGLHRRHCRFHYVRLPTLAVQLGGQLAQIGPQRLSQNGVGSMH